LSPLRLVFFGTPDIAVPALERLIAGPHEVVGVVTQPDRARGRGRKASPTPVAEVALREGIELLRPEHVGDDQTLSRLRAMRPDLGIVVAFGQFLPRKVRTLPRCGYLINAHASLLPRYRGAAPIARAILEDQAETGISIMRVEREMDAGPVAHVVRTPIRWQEDTAALSARLAALAASAIAEVVDQIAGDHVVWTEQDASRATAAPKLEKSDALLDLTQDARSLACRIHALAPRPGGSVTLVSGEGDLETGVSLKITRADVMPYGAATKDQGRPRPGTIVREADGGALRIATGDGWLVPLVVQRAGGKALPIADFLRGFELASDARAALPASDAGCTR